MCMSVHVTELHDVVFIGFTMNHCIADGTSLWYFISTLSEIFDQIKDENEDEKESISISKKPIFETLFPYKRYDKVFKLPYLEPQEFITRYDRDPLRVKMFHFPAGSKSTLKSQANYECGLHNNVSSFQALSVFIWRSITRARNLHPDDEIECTIIVNGRTRLDPQLTPEYFRSFLTAVQCISKGDNLINSGLGRTALLVNKNINSQDDKAVKTWYKYIDEHPCVVQPGPSSIYYKPNNITIAGSTRFNVYGPQFGIGKAITVLASYGSRDDGKVTAYPGRDGDGSVDLEICLKPETMNVLELDQEFMSLVSSY